MVPFKATTTALSDHFVLPLAALLISARITGSGQADLLGPFTVTGQLLIHPGLAGSPSAITDGIQVFAAANGDALFISYSGLSHATATPDVIAGDQVFTITGGRGRFVGATGGGTMTSQSKGTPSGASEVITTLEGLITAPKP
jgi:hypothetical protein